MGNKQKKMTEMLFLHVREPRSWWERYCSHVLEPGEYVFISVLLLLFFAGFGVLMFVETRPLQIEELDRVETAFAVYTVNEDGEIVLCSDSYEGEFLLTAERDDLEETMARVCETGAVYTAYVEYFENVENYRIAMLAAPDGSELVGLAETNAVIRKERIQFLAITAVLLLLWAGFTFGMFYVGAYPERHPHLVRLFYKDSAIFY